MRWDHQLPGPELISSERWFIGVVWAVIIAKCMVVKWAVVATLLWHRETDRIIFRNTSRGR